MKPLRWTILLFFLAVFSACVEQTSNLPPLKTPDRVDMQRYLGLWHEIARIDHAFQKGCVASTAEYSLRDDGLIRVINRCRKESVNGPEAVAEGKAWIVDTKTNAWLKVQFFWPFAGDYVIIDLDGENYRWAVVGHPSREYLWILSRSRELSQDVYEGIMERLARQGYDTALIRDTSLFKKR